MQTDIVSRAVLARMKSMSGEGQPAVSLTQIRMWVVPQKGGTGSRLQHQPELL